MSFDCLTQKGDVAGIESIILGVDQSKGSNGGGYTFLKTALLATINRDALPENMKPVRPETPILMNVGSLYISYEYDPKHTDFSSGIQIHGYSTKGWFLGRDSFTKIQPGTLEAQINSLPDHLQRVMISMRRASDRYDPRLGVSELLSDGKISRGDLARFGVQASDFKLERK